MGEFDSTMQFDMGYCIPCSKRLREEVEEEQRGTDMHQMKSHQLNIFDIIIRDKIFENMHKKTLFGYKEDVYREISGVDDGVNCAENIFIDLVNEMLRDIKNKKMNMK